MILGIDRPSRPAGSDCGSLPSPELNPLLNPVLGQNMGRWAEVYFTAHPEKRDEAVRALLHDLQSSPPLDSRNVPVEATPLVFEPAAQETSGVIDERSEGRESQRPVSVDAEPSLPAGPESPTKANEKIREAIGRWAHWPERMSLPDFATFLDLQAQRYGIYLTAALATLVLSLAYMTWRDTMVWSSNVRLVSPASGADHRGPPRTGSPIGRNSDSSSGAAITAQPPHFSSTSRPGGSSSLDRGIGAGQSGIVLAASQQNLLPGNASLSRASSGNGSEELAMAKNLLNGKAGAPRDTVQAAEWLWKAVRKQNATAELMLSELYLDGDGVPKSCDQARLLLQAAARKGIPGTTERIHNLANFGCE